MFQQTAWAAMRNLTQIYAQTIGGATGVRIIQTTQFFNILGSGGGYQLAANSFVAILAAPDKRTAMFGVLSGCTMLGSSTGYTCECKLAHGHVAPRFWPALTTDNRAGC